MATRLARMKALIIELEQACAANADNAERFRQLKAELNAARAQLKTIHFD